MNAAFDQLHEEFACTHEVEARRRVILAKGREVVTVYRQCGLCGKSFGAVAKAGFTEAQIAALPAFDEELPRTYWEAYHDRRQQLQAEQNAAWWEWYTAYLESPEWAVRRRRALKREALYQGRAQPWCEQCWERPAVEVHHADYAHVGEELTWELRVVCARCHEMITRRSREARSRGPAS